MLRFICSAEMNILLEERRNMRELIKVMKAVSDPMRIKILKMLQRKMMCVCEIQTALGLAQSSTSKHLKLLEEAGFITYHKDGLWVNYSLVNGSGSPYVTSLLKHFSQWLEDDEEIMQLIERLPEIDREIIRGQ